MNKLVAFFYFLMKLVRHIIINCVFSSRHAILMTDISEICNCVSTLFYDNIFYSTVINIL